jgi:hypothetical protein
MYKVGTFEGNFVRAVFIILCKLAFLSAVGLFFGVFVSFPIACLCTFALYLVGLGHDWWMEAIGANMQVYSVTVDPYGRLGPFIRFVLEPILVVCAPNFSKFNGTGLLVEGQYISPLLLSECVLRTVVFGGVLLLGLGWAVFRNREIAQVQI